MNDSLDQAFEALKTYAWGVDPKVLRPIEEAMVATHGDAAARKDLEARLIAVLAAEVPRAAKDAVCRMLRNIGTAAAVPALAALLPDADLSHMARYALEPMPAPEAGQALLAALPKSSGKLRIGIIASLGSRAETAAIAPLQALLVDSDPATAAAAAYALGDIGSLDAAKVLVTAKTSSATKSALADACLKCAGNLLAAGNKNAAGIIYAKLLASTPSALVQAAANHGQQQCGGK